MYIQRCIGHRHRRKIYTPLWYIRIVGGTSVNYEDESYLIPHPSPASVVSSTVEPPVMSAHTPQLTNGAVVLVVDTTAEETG
jgi:hypothetical protein